MPFKRSPGASVKPPPESTIKMVFPGKTQVKKETIVLEEDRLQGIETEHI